MAGNQDCFLISYPWDRFGRGVAGELLGIGVAGELLGIGVVF